MIYAVLEIIKNDIRRVIAVCYNGSDAQTVAYAAQGREIIELGADIEEYYQVGTVIHPPRQ